MSEAKLTLTGSGSVGDIDNWSVQQAVTPIAIGDPAVSGGKITVTARRNNGQDDDSAFTIGNSLVLATPDAGTVGGVVQEVSNDSPASTTLNSDTLLSRLAIDVRADPLWVDTVANTFLTRAQLGDNYGVAVDSTRGIIYVAGYIVTGPGTNSTVILAFDTSFNLVGSIGASSGAGIIDGPNIQMAVDEVDGSVYVLCVGVASTIKKFSVTNTFLWGVNDGFPLSLTVDPVSQKLYVGYSAGTVPSIASYNPSGTTGGDFQFMNPGEFPMSMRFNPVDKMLYVGTQSDAPETGTAQVVIFTPQLTRIGQIDYDSLHGQVS
jgi:hypothetical protein